MDTQITPPSVAGPDSDTSLAADSNSAAEETFAKAVAALDAGDYQHGANLVYQAAVQAVRAAAGRLGMPSDTREELKAVVYKLDGFDPEAAWQAYLADPTITLDLPLYRGYFSVAESFKEHAEIPLDVQARDTERYWQPEEYAWFLSPVEELIRLLRHNETGAASE
ncbi:MAG: hypothetical protein OXL37_18595 [Chloroflexota bacterium]|nr:hypothetical protein [Chloroflexota bacterium]MDE2960005.1 hypothetical protein [Chloroflexota bacterium]